MRENIHFRDVYVRLVYVCRLWIIGCDCYLASVVVRLVNNVVLPCEHHPISLIVMCPPTPWSGASPEHALGVPKPPLWDSGPGRRRGVFALPIGDVVKQQSTPLPRG